MPGHHGRIGDMDLFVDPDTKTAYQVRTSFSIVKLDENYTSPVAEVSNFAANAEAPVMFKRGEWYYILVGLDCCYCLGGSNALVYMSKSVEGPWVFDRDIGSNPTPWDPHSPHNFVTKAQAQKVFPVPGSGGTDTAQYVWLGSQWNSGLSETPPGPRNHDLLYWSPLQFQENGSLVQMVWQDNVTITV